MPLFLLFSWNYRNQLLFFPWQSLFLILAPNAMHYHHLGGIAFSLHMADSRVFVSSPDLSGILLSICPDSYRIPTGRLKLHVYKMKRILLHESS